MTGTLVNVLLIIVGSIIGLLFRRKLKQRILDGLMSVMGIAVLVIGVTGAVKTGDMLCMIVSLAIGTFVGEGLNIEKRLESAGNAMHKLFSRFNTSSTDNRFTEGFVSATVLFCVGAMAVMGSLEAGVSHDYTILFSKGIIDGVTSIAFAAALGIGVIFSAVSVGIYQGAITLLAVWVAPYLSQTAVAEMSAAGSVVIIGIAINMLGLGKKKLNVGNMLPSVFIPLAYIPLVEWISGLIK